MRCARTHRVSTRFPSFESRSGKPKPDVADERQMRRRCRERREDAHSCGKEDRCGNPRLSFAKTASDSFDDDPCSCHERTAPGDWG